MKNNYSPGPTSGALKHIYTYIHTYWGGFHKPRNEHNSRSIARSSTPIQPKHHSNLSEREQKELRPSKQSSEIEFLSLSTSKTLVIRKGRGGSTADLHD